MTHPMKPTPEQLTEWLQQALKVHPDGRAAVIAGHVAYQAYAAGADAELEACSEWAAANAWHKADEALFCSRRLAPLTPREKALQALERIEDAGFFWINQGDIELIRQGLEDAAS